MSPRVTVILPLYNKAPYVARAIRSILAQSFADFELIIVDDGSTDGGGEIARAFRDPRLFVVTQENRGPGAARNTGLALAGGEFVAFLDGDDAWRPDYLHHAVGVFDRTTTKLGAVVACYIEFPKERSMVEYWKRRKITEGVVNVDPRLSPHTLVSYLAYMSAWSTVARRDSLLRWGGFYSRDHCTYGEDAFLWLKVLLNEKVHFSLSPLVEYHREASSLTNRERRARPVEPFLRFPGEVRRCCPPSLRPLLNQTLALRAMKTVCVLGYWGELRRARALYAQYRKEAPARHHLTVLARVMTSWLGPTLAALYRWWFRTWRGALHDLQHFKVSSWRRLMHHLSINRQAT